MNDQTELMRLLTKRAEALDDNDAMMAADLEEKLKQLFDGVRCALCSHLVILHAPNGCPVEGEIPCQCGRPVIRVVAAAEHAAGAADTEAEQSLDGAAVEDPPPADAKRLKGWATYNITNDKLYAGFNQRLSKTDYERMKKANFAWWHGSRQFVAKWSTYAEDLLYDLGIEDIEEDDTPDDVEARVDRFSGYAENAARNSEATHKYVDGIASHIPMGQPILVGHHSERRHRRDIKRMDNGMRRAIDEADRAAYWNDRIAASIRHAEYKERPAVISRRIERMEADERKYLKNMSQKEKVYQWLNFWSEERYKAEKEGRTPDKDEALTRFEKRWESNCRHWNRWLEHVRMRIAYEKELYKISGGIVADTKKPEAGGGVLIAGEWFRVVRVNKKTVEIINPRHKYYNKRDLDTISDVMSKADYEAQYGALPAKEPEPLIEPKETITKAEWKKYQYWHQAFVKGGCRHIIRGGFAKREEVPVLVEGMPKPARRSQ